MQIIRRRSALRAAVAALKTGDKSVALVPTMGALHAGHLALVAEGARRADHVVASIFVNPMQFGPNEDLERYPRREAEDLAALQAAGCAIAWVPDAAEMYPQGFATSIAVSGVSGLLEGAARPRIGLTIKIRRPVLPGAPEMTDRQIALLAVASRPNRARPMYLPVG